MSDMNARNGGDPLAPDVIEESIAASLRPGAPTTSTALLVRALADAYTLPPAAEAVLARSRATLARRAEALGSREPRAISSDTWEDATTPISRPPQPPRRQHTQIGVVWRTAAAVLVVALLSASFYALLRGMQRQGVRPTPTATHPPVSATATPTTIPPQPPAPAGVYVTLQGTLFRIDPRTGALRQRYLVTSSNQAYFGAPVVANGIVYLIYTSTESPRQTGVVAVSATSGAQLWRTQTAAALLDLSLAGGTLYGGTATGTGSETFYALRASDGSLLWTFHTATLRAVPIVTGGVVYLADQPQNTPLQHIHALRASDGSQLWDTPLPQACGTALFEVLDQGTVFISCGVQLANNGQFIGGDGVYALRASDGSLLWHSATYGQPTVMAAGAGLLYVSFGGKNAAGATVTGLDALDETSGALRWQNANGGGWPQFDGTTVYISHDVGLAQVLPQGSSYLAAFSASNGTLLWTYPEANQRIQLAPPVIAGGVVYQVLDEQVVAISAASGALLWRSPALGGQQVAPAGLSVVTGG